jgi:hypothetical protein
MALLLSLLLSLIENVMMSNFINDTPKLTSYLSIICLPFRQLYEYTGFNENESTALPNDVESLHILRRVINAQTRRYHEVRSKYKYLFSRESGHFVPVKLTDCCFRQCNYTPRSLVIFWGYTFIKMLSFIKCH